jgi:two-component system phosphate regulon response regulator PhoB
MPRALVVEDNVDIGWLICHALRTAGWVTDLAHRGDLALDRLARPPLPDLVVLDYRMPELTGEDVLRAIRVHPQLAEIPIVLCTADGRDAVSDEVRGLVSAVIEKPFTSAQLVSAALAAISPQPAEHTRSPG